MYADDTSLSYKSKDLTQLNMAINDDLRKLETWFKGNKISLNVAKTHSMLICSKSKHRSIKISGKTFVPTIRDKSLDIVGTTKYLGVQIDQNLDWKEHIKYVASKVSRAIGFLKYAKSLVPSTTLINLYKALWNRTSDTAALSGVAVVQQKKPLEETQKQGCKNNYW